MQLNSWSTKYVWNSTEMTLGIARAKTVHAKKKKKNLDERKSAPSVVEECHHLHVDFGDVKHGKNASFRISETRQEDFCTPRL